MRNWILNKRTPATIHSAPRAHYIKLSFFMLWRLNCISSNAVVEIHGGVRRGVKGGVEGHVFDWDRRKHAVVSSCRTLGILNSKIVTQIN